MPRHRALFSVAPIAPLVSFGKTLSEAGWEIVLDRFELNFPDFSLLIDAEDTEVVHLSADQLGLVSLSVGAEGIGLGGIDLEHPELFVERAWLLGLGDAPDDGSLRSQFHGDVVVLLAPGGKQDNLGPQHQTCRCASATRPPLKDLAFVVVQYDLRCHAHGYRLRKLISTRDK